MASLRLSGCLINMSQHLFCKAADYFLLQARPITLLKWYHINQNLTRWQIWSYQIPRDTTPNMSLSQDSSAGMPPPCQIYCPTGSQRASWENYHIQKSGSTYENAIWKVKARRLWTVERVKWIERDWLHFNIFSSFHAILCNKTRWLSLVARTSPLTLYMMMFIHHIMTATSNKQQTCKPSNLKYADATCAPRNTDHFSLCSEWLFALFKLDFPSTGNSHKPECVIKYTSIR